MICLKDYYKLDTICTCRKCPPPKSLLGRVIQHYGRVCYLCNLEISDTIDHVVPKSKGGTNDLSNLRPACKKCNAEKGDKSLSEYLFAKYGIAPSPGKLVKMR